MKKRAIFLDRDGTINEDVGYVYKISDFQFLPGVIDALKMLYDAEYELIIITNQSGIARGYYTEEQYLALDYWIKEELKNKGIHIRNSYYCPHLPDAVVPKYRKICNCRKPALGLFNQAIEELDLDMNGSYAIGDRLRDCVICGTTNVRGYLIGNTENREIIQNVISGKYSNISWKTDLFECAKDILKGISL